MKTSAILALAAANAVQMVAGHATVFNILVNDVDQGLGNSASGYIRSPPNNNPITDVTSKDMTCNVNGGTAAAKTIEVAGGDKITFEWHHNNNEASDDIIADVRIHAREIMGTLSNNCVVPQGPRSYLYCSCRF